MKSFVVRLVCSAVFLAAFLLGREDGLFSALLGLFFGMGAGLFSPVFFGGERKLSLLLSAAFGAAAGFPGAVVWLGIGILLCRVARRFSLPFPEEVILSAALPGAWGILFLLG